MKRQTKLPGHWPNCFPIFKVDPIRRGRNATPNFHCKVQFALGAGKVQQLDFYMSRREAAKGGAMKVYAWSVNIDGQNIIAWESRTAKGFITEIREAREMRKP